MDKSSGIGFDRQAFATSGEQATRPPSPLTGIALILVAVVAIGFVRKLQDPGARLWRHFCRR